MGCGSSTPASATQPAAGPTKLAPKPESKPAPTLPPPVIKAEVAVEKEARFNSIFLCACLASSPQRAFSFLRRLLSTQALDVGAVKSIGAPMPTKVVDVLSETPWGRAGQRTDPTSGVRFRVAYTCPFAPARADCRFISTLFAPGHPYVCCPAAQSSSIEVFCNAFGSHVGAR